MWKWLSSLNKLFVEGVHFRLFLALDSTVVPVFFWNVNDLVGHRPVVVDPVLTPPITRTLEQGFTKLCQYQIVVLLF